MSSITINLPDEKLHKLQELANHFRISVEDLARLSIEELLVAPADEFERSTDYLLKKNEELYRRLAESV